MDTITLNSSGLTLTLLLFTVILLLVRFYVMRNLNHWRKKGIFYLQPEPFFGNYRAVILMKESYYETQLKIYRQLKGHPYGGTYEGNSPSLVIMDPELIKKVLVNDADHFQARTPLSIKYSYYMSKIPLITPEMERKQFRMAIDPHISSSKISQIFGQILEESQNLTSEIDKAIDEQGGDSSGPIDVGKVVGQIGGKIIWKMIMSDSPPRQVLDTLHHFHKTPTWQSSILVACIMSHIPHFLSRLIPVAFIHETYMKELAEKYIKPEIKNRLGNGKRKEDILQKLMDFVINYSEKKNLFSKTTLKREEERSIISQVLILVEASYTNIGEITASMLRLLSENQDVQAKLRQEIDQVLNHHSGEISNKSIGEMTFLNKVLAETLRCFPILARMERTCTKDYTFPTGLKIERGTRVNIPLYGLHNDPEYFLNPEQYNPERFTNLTAKKPLNTYFPFGSGSRKCPGLYYSELSIKIFTVQLLKKYMVLPWKPDCKQPLSFAKWPLVLEMEGGIWIIFNRRSDKQHSIHTSSVG